MDVKNTLALNTNLCHAAGLRAVNKQLVYIGNNIKIIYPNTAMYPKYYLQYSYAIFNPQKRA